MAADEYYIGYILIDFKHMSYTVHLKEEGSAGRTVTHALLLPAKV